MPTKTFYGAKLSVEWKKAVSYTGQTYDDPPEGWPTGYYTKSGNVYTPVESGATFSSSTVYYKVDPTVLPDIDDGKDAQGFVNQNLATTMGVIGQYLADYKVFKGHTHNISDLTGSVPVARGGTGVQSLNIGEVLVGSGTEPVSTKQIDSTVTGESTHLITSGAVHAAITALGKVFNIKTVGQYTSVDQLPTTGNNPGDVHLIRLVNSTIYVPTGYLSEQPADWPDGYYRSYGQLDPVESWEEFINDYYWKKIDNRVFVPTGYLSEQPADWPDGYYAKEAGQEQAGYDDWGTWNKMTTGDTFSSNRVYYTLSNPNEIYIPCHFEEQPADWPNGYYYYDATNRHNYFDAGDFIPSETYYKLGESDNSFEEYVWIQETGSATGRWELFGKINDVPINDASTSVKGIVKLVDNISSWPISGDCNATTEYAVKSFVEGKGYLTSVPYYTSNPSAPGTATPGTSNYAARGDHVHPLQTTSTTQTQNTNNTTIATTAFVHQDALCMNDNVTINCV